MFIATYNTENFLHFFLKSEFWRMKLKTTTLRFKNSVKDCGISTSEHKPLEFVAYRPTQRGYLCTVSTFEEYTVQK